MDAPKTFIAVLYLLIYSSFSTADLSIGDTIKIDKALSSSKELFTFMDTMAKWSNEGEVTVGIVLKVFSGMAKIASSLGFIGALIGFIFAFIPQQDPKFEFIKEQFAEVNRKLDSISLKISSLQKQMEWTDYASVYGIDENKIKNSWTKLKELMESAPLAKTQEEKTRLAERFTTFYENTGTEGSVYNFYGYITNINPASLSKNLLKLVIEKSNGDFKILVQYSSYFSSLMLSGLQLNLYYYALKGFDGAAKAKEAVTQLSNIQTAIRDALIGCADDFEIWARKDVEEIGTQSFSDNKKLAYGIKEHLDQKFNWYDWTVIVHDSKAKNELTYGHTIDLTVQDKARVHLIHREKGFHVDESIKTQMANEWDGKGELCPQKTSLWPVIFNNRIMKHVEFIHEPSDYDQTQDSGHVKLTCPERYIITQQRQKIYTDYKTFTIYLQSANVVEKPPCSELKCHNGQCKQIKDTTDGFCKCHQMFYGSTCEENAQNDIDYGDIENQINTIGFQPVPDMTAIYFSIKDMKEYTGALINSLRQDILWTQVFVKYNFTVFEKFRYLTTSHVSLENGTMPQNIYVSEVQILFSHSDTFLHMLFIFDQMMQGTGLGDKSNILDIFRKSLLSDKENQPDDPFECSESYANKVDYIVRFMFALEKDSVLAWMKYLLITHKSKDIVDGTLVKLNNNPYVRTMLSNSKNDEYLKYLFNNYVTEQWSLFNKNGCGSLKAEGLSNSYCEKPYHSTDQQKIQLKCRDDNKPYPKTVQCSKGRWSDLPVCYTDPMMGGTECKSESGATVCTATCLSGWTFTDGRSSESYRCTMQPCQSFKPKNCDRCIADHVCKSNEVCSGGKCVDGCSVFSCGVNAGCSTSNHIQTCTCVSLWKPWRYESPDQGCRYQDLQWVPTTAWSTIPHNTVSSKAGYYVCRAKGPDGGWHGGWIWMERKTCNYEYDWKEHLATEYQALVDPCGGNGVKWLDGGIYTNGVQIGRAVLWELTYYVCSAKDNGIPGKLFNTRHGLMCNIGYEDSIPGSNTFAVRIELAWHNGTNGIIPKSTNSTHRALQAGSIKPSKYL